jgi:predicted  nucleic acid-binding Zn-ribbon protein
MKSLRRTVFASLVGGAFLALAATSHAAFDGRSFNHSALANDIRSDRNEIQQEREKLSDDRRDLNQDREKLRDDRRDRASHPEIANDRSDIRQDRQDIAHDRHDLQVERRDLRHDFDQERHSFFDWWHSWWNRR